MVARTFWVYSDTFYDNFFSLFKSKNHKPFIRTAVSAAEEFLLWLDSLQSNVFIYIHMYAYISFFFSFVPLSKAGNGKLLNKIFTCRRVTISGILTWIFFVRHCACLCAEIGHCCVSQPLDGILREPCNPSGSALLADAKMLVLKKYFDCQHTLNNPSHSPNALKCIFYPKGWFCPAFYM